jgi:O-antigen ligase
VVAVEVLIVIAALSRKLAFAALIGTVGCISVLALFSFQPIQPILQFYDPSQVYGLERLRIWADAWTIYLTHPLFGVGAGNFQFFDNSLNVQIAGAGVSHNQYLTVLAESGPLALCFLVLFLIKLFHWIGSNCASEYSLLRLHSVAAMAATAAMVIQGFAGDTFLVSASASGGTLVYCLTAYYWLLLATVFALSSQHDEAQVRTHEPQMEARRPPDGRGTSVSRG